MKDSFSQTFLPIPFGALFSSRSHSFFWRRFDKLFLSVSCFFFFFRLFGFGRVIDGILEFVYLRLGFDRLGNQDVFVSLNYNGSGVCI